MAAKEGHLEVFKYIMERVTDKNPSNDNNTTPFHLAVKYSHFDIVDYISKNIGRKKIKYADFCVWALNNRIDISKVPLFYDMPDNDPDDGPDNNPGDNPGSNPGDNPGENPGDNPGD